MAHCPWEKMDMNLTQINRTHMESRPLLNLSLDDLEFMRRQLQADLGRAYCDGWIKDMSIAYDYVHGYISLVVCLFGSIANILNIVVLTRDDMSSAPINKILTALAVAELMVMLEYVPFSIYMIYEAEKRDFTYRGALFLLCHVLFSQVMHTISISLTLMLAVWRYIAVSNPQLSMVWCTDSRCHFAIGVSCVLPVFLCFPAYFITKISAQPVDENFTTQVLFHLDLGDTSYVFNLWFYAVVIKLVPCVILTAISLCLINALYQVNQRKRILKGYNACGDCSAPQRKITKADRRAERTTKMLVAVLLLFLITEFPQGILGLLSGIYGRCFYSKCYQYTGSLMDIMALLNGAINFILYCAMSRQFRITFSKLFKPRALLNWGPPSKVSQEIHSTLV